MRSKSEKRETFTSVTTVAVTVLKIKNTKSLR